MNEVNDFNKYKRAKIITKELEKVLNIINLSLKGLKPFRKYTSISETLLCLEDSKSILEIHLEHQKKILENKGRVVDKI